MDAAAWMHHCLCAGVGAGSPAPAFGQSFSWHRVEKWEEARRAERDEVNSVLPLCPSDACVRGGRGAGPGAQNGVRSTLGRLVWFSTASRSAPDWFESLRFVLKT